MTAEYLDPATRRRVERELDELRADFRGIFGAETIERYIAESVEDLEVPASRPTCPSSSTVSPVAACELSPRSKEPS